MLFKHDNYLIVFTKDIYNVGAIVTMVTEGVVCGFNKRHWMNSYSIGK